MIRSPHRFWQASVVVGLCLLLSCHLMPCLYCCTVCIRIRMAFSSQKRSQSAHISRCCCVFTTLGKASSVCLSLFPTSTPSLPRFCLPQTLQAPRSGRCKHLHIIQHFRVSQKWQTDAWWLMLMEHVSISSYQRGKLVTITASLKNKT